MSELSIAARQRVHEAVRRMVSRAVEGELSSRGIRWCGMVNHHPVKGPLNNPEPAPEWYVAQDIKTAVHEGVAGSLEEALDVFEAVCRAAGAEVGGKE